MTSAAIAAVASGSKKKAKPKGPTAAVMAAPRRGRGGTAADSGTAPATGTAQLLWHSNVMGAAPGL